MNFHRVAAVCALAFVASLASAQPAETAGSTETPVAPPAAKQDCVKRHDHGAERQVPTPQAGCKSERVAKTKPRVKKNEAIQGHDHGKIHKNQ